MLGQRLGSVIDLSERDLAAVRALPMSLVKVPAKQDILRSGDAPSRFWIIIDGFTCWKKYTGWGTAQITSIHVPGDIPYAHPFYPARVDGNLRSLTECVIGHIENDALLALKSSNPTIRNAWRVTQAFESSLLRSWVVNVGARPALARIAHLFCELIVRLNAVGMVRNWSCKLPITQTELGEATGLSVVHINRSLQKLRKQGLIRFSDGTLTVLDWPGLKQIADFDSAYLQFSSDAVL